MAIILSEEQRQAVLKGEAVRLTSPELGEDVVVLRAETYEAFRERLEDQEEKAAWAELARQASDRWAAENPF